MPASDALLGRIVAGKIEIEALVGRGAMGSVYRARHLTLGESVAVKVMHPEYAVDAEFAERFRREATAMVRLKHPNSVRVLDFGQEADGLLYLVMEYLEGVDLGRLMQRESPLAPARIAHLLRQTLSALQVAHDADIIHRDVKPENIFVVIDRDDDGAPTEVAKVCDFGIAQIRDARVAKGGGSRPQRLTSAGIVVGTPDYMSPEQGRADPIDARSDLYSVGVILYELLTGHVPFESETAVEIILRHVTEVPASPSALVPDVDPRLEFICLKALSKAPAERFASAREMRAALGEIDGGVAALPSITATHEVTSAPRTRRAPWRLPALLALASIGAFAAIRFGAGRPTLLQAHELSLPSPSLPSTPSALATEGPVTATAAPITSATPAPTRSLRIDLPASPRLPPSGAPPPAPGDPPMPTVAASTAPLSPPPSSAPAPTPIVALSAPVPAAPPLDISAAHVVLAGVGNTEGVLKSAVASALGRQTGAMSACYRAGLRGVASADPTRGALHVETDDSGTVTSASARVPFPSSVARCIERAVVGVRFSGVDTGTASADVTLAFEVR